MPLQITPTVTAPPAATVAKAAGTSASVTTKMRPRREVEQDGKAPMVLVGAWDIEGGETDIVSAAAGEASNARIIAIFFICNPLL